MAEISALSHDLLEQAIGLLRLVVEAEPPRLFLKPVAGDLPGKPALPAAEPPRPDRDQLRLRAIRLFRGRRGRGNHFPEAIFGEPAWDVLLLLYIRDWPGARTTPDRLGEAVGAPARTILRWLDCLERESLAEREPRPDEPCGFQVRISGRGRELLDTYLAELET